MKILLMTLAFLSLSLSFPSFSQNSEDSMQPLNSALGNENISEEEQVAILENEEGVVNESDIDTSKIEETMDDL